MVDHYTRRTEQDLISLSKRWFGGREYLYGNHIETYLGFLSWTVDAETIFEGYESIVRDMSVVVRLSCLFGMVHSATSRDVVVGLGYLVGLAHSVTSRVIVKGEIVLLHVTHGHDGPVLVDQIRRFVVV